jgi:hypothetical protein
MGFNIFNIERTFWLFSALPLSGFLFLAPARSISAESLLIAEVQIAGESANNDFIKIYNPGNNDLDITGFKLRKRSSSGSESSIRVFPKDSKVLAKNYFLWTNSEGNFASSIGANISSKTTLARNNSIAILDPDGQILDSLAWGESQNPFAEGQPFLENPEANQKLERKQSNNIYQDTDNNIQDFYLDPIRNNISNGANPPSDSENQSSIEENQSKDYPENILINEILPSPLGSDEKEEWIEISNQNNFEVDLSGWQLSDKVGKITTYNIPEGTKISPLGFLVFDRPSTKIVLNNDGDSVSLSQPDGKLVETINYGKAPQNQSFARQDSTWTWTTTLTPGKSNVITEQETEDKEVEGESDGKEKLITTGQNNLGKDQIYPSGIFINEILPSPTGPDEQEEWIEIFNSNNSEVNLSDWKIQDTAGKTKTYVLLQGTKIPSQGFLVLSRPETKITLNNDGDGLKLINPNGDIIDQVSYEKSPSGQSYNRIPLESKSLTGQADSGWAWSENLTPGVPNNIPQISEEGENEENTEIPGKGLASISKQFPKISHSFLILLAALVIAIFSGIIILILKKSVKDTHS